MPLIHLKDRQGVNTTRSTFLTARSWEEHLRFYLTNLTDNSIDEDSVTKKNWTALELTRHPGADGIQPRFIKALAAEVCYPLSVYSEDI